MHLKLHTLFTSRVPIHFFIPKTQQKIVIFPTRIELNGKVIILIKGFVKKFQVFLDLKRGSIEARGFVEGKFFNYRIEADKNQVYLVGLKNICSKKLLITETIDKICLEEMHFGMHKKMNIEKIFERKEFRELLPIWFHLSQLFPRVKAQRVTLFDQLEELKKERKHDQIALSLMQLFSFLFPDTFLPAYKDILHIGYPWKFHQKEKDFPFLLLQKSGEFIRSLFFEEKKETLLILPHLIPELPFGKFFGFHSKFGQIDLRISKKKPFFMNFLPSHTKSLIFEFPKQLKSCRVRIEKQKRGTRHPLPLKINFEENKLYQIDRFEK